MEISKFSNEKLNYILIQEDIEDDLKLEILSELDNRYMKQSRNKKISLLLSICLFVFSMFPLIYSVFTGVTYVAFQAEFYYLIRILGIISSIHFINKYYLF